MLRETGCRLPVQIWHRGAEEPVRPSDLDGLGTVTVHDLTAVRTAPRRLVGWEAKTVALLASGLERVFFHDSDAYCVADPTGLLDRLSPEEPFLFWEDLPGTSRNVNWATWGLSGDHIPAVQGGQCAVHLTHFWREFVLAYWLDQHSDFSYSHQYGDQDSWRVALARTGGRYGCIGCADWDELAFTCSHRGRPVVVHRCQAKMLAPEYTGGGDGINNRRLDRLPEEARAWGHYEAILSDRTAAEVFGGVHARGAGGPHRSSGAGSSPEQTAPYLETVNALARVGGWRRVVDLGCGDGSIASRLDAPRVVGVDCYGPHVERLRREFPHREWHELDLDRDREKLPAGDAALLKDVLHHWPNRLVREWLLWARGCGKWRWFVCTQDRPHPGQAADCPLGGLRGLDAGAEVFRDLGVLRVTDYLGKSVLMLPAGAAG
jgi:SAM-dependent methyltransferase